MNVVKNVKNKNCAILWMNEMSDNVCNCIKYISRSFDVYIYLHKSSKINDLIFSSLYPINGYIYGDKNESLGLIEVINYISEVIESYYGVYVVNLLNSSDEYEYVTNNLNDILSRGLFSSSIFKSVETSYEDRKITCLKKRHWWKIFNRDTILGMNSTHESYGGCLLLYSDLPKILSMPDEYMNTFERIFEFIPSSFNNLGIPHLDLELMNILSTA